MQTSLKQTDFLLINDLFQMHGGFVLNFSDPTFGDFFRSEVGIDIDHPSLKAEGTSKAKRLRYFLKTIDTATVVRALEALWDHRNTYMQHNGEAETVRDASSRFQDLLNRLKGKATTSPPSPIAHTQTVDATTIIRLAAELTSLVHIQPQPRGYKFETFLKDLFNAHGLKAAKPFRIRGEQIDGSFELDGHTYLLEAKWHNEKTAAEQLRVFNAKLDEKIAWARGLFVSYSGFTDDGLHAFGRGKKVICMDGLDLFETLSRNLPLGDVLKKKERRAVETGNPFVPVSALF